MYLKYFNILTAVNAIAIDLMSYNGADTREPGNGGFRVIPSAKEK